MVSKQETLEDVELRTLTDRDGFEAHATIQWYGKENHKFKIHWPKQDRGETNAIGIISLKTANITVDDNGIYFCDKTLDEGCYWDLDNKDLYKVSQGIHNIHPQEMLYPDDDYDDMTNFEQIDSFELPDTFGMYLNLDDGTLGFSIEDKDLGVAFDDIHYRVWYLSFCSKGGSFERMKVWKCVE